MSKIAIYLAGSIKRGLSDMKETTYWTTADENSIIDSFGIDYSIELLNPATFIVDRRDSFATFGADMYLIGKSDFLFMDARDKKGIGVGAEMMAAKYFKIPVVCLCPVGSHYRKHLLPNVYGVDLHNWMHPFVAGLSDFVADTIADGISWMIQHISTPQPFKSLNVIEEARNHFVDTQLKKRDL